MIGSILEVGGLKKEQARRVLQFLTVVLILFVGLRFHTGSDWDVYIRVFDNSLLEDDNPYHMEYGYIVLNKILKFLFDNYYVLQFTVTAFVGFMLYRFVSSFSHYPITTITIFVCFFFFHLMSIQRQLIALGIVVFSTRYIFERKLLVFLCAISIASLFHISAIGAILLYFIHKNYGRIFPLILIFLSHILYFYPGSLKYIIEFFVPYLPDRLSTISMLHLSNVVYGNGVNYSTGLTHITHIIIGLSYFFFRKNADPKTIFFANAIVVLLIIRGLSTAISILLRFELYYLIYAIIAYTYLTDFFKGDRQIKVFVTSCFLSLFSLIIINGVSSNTRSQITGLPYKYRYRPYYNVLSHPPEAVQRRDWVEWKN
ncbi:MAG: EpsG family protein [Tannerellaceae bacterium]|nr:EpsG family protein [Tannerellaceae bacterium]